jgi:hypothetical protein
MVRRSLGGETTEPHPPRRIIIEFLQPFLVHSNHAHPCPRQGWLQGWLRSPCWGPYPACITVNSSQANIPTSGPSGLSCSAYREIAVRLSCKTTDDCLPRPAASASLTTIRPKSVDMAPSCFEVSRGWPWCGTWAARTRRRKDADQMAFPPTLFTVAPKNGQVR